MKSYINELAPWERKNEYFHNIQLGKDVRNQTALLQTALQKQAKQQLLSVNSIVASQNMVKSSIDEMKYSVSNLTSVTEKGFFDVSEGLQGLQNSFEWGISEVVWQIEQNRKILKNILEVLMAPLDTQAKELRYRAEEAYANGWYNDALEDFIESEKRNKYDFSVHISIGMIYLFHLIDKKKSVEYFEKAIKYAKPKSPYHASYALLYKGLIMRDMLKINEAEHCSEEAMIISPDFLEAQYQNAQYNALLKRSDKAIAVLSTLLKKNIFYCIKLDTDKTFDPIKVHIENFLIEIRDSMITQCKNTISPVKQDFMSFEKNADNVLNKFPAASSNFKKGKVPNYFQYIDRLLDNNSILDAAEAKNMISNIDQIEKYRNDVIDDLKNKQKYFIDKINNLKNNADGAITKCWDNSDYKNVEIETNPFMFFGFLIYFQLFALPVCGVFGWASGQWKISFYLSEILACLTIIWLFYLGPYLNRQKAHEVERETKNKILEEIKTIETDKQKFDSLLERIK